MKKNFLLLFGALFFILIMIESVFRLLGIYSPFIMTKEAVDVNFESSIIDGQPYYEWNRKIYEVDYTDLLETRTVEFKGISHSITMDSSGTRFTGAKDSLSNIGYVDFIGCSFTFGSYLSDYQTMAFKVQERFPGIIVTNYGFPGGGMDVHLDNLIKVKTRHKSSSGPRIIFLNYSYLHSERNCHTSFYSKQMMKGQPYPVYQEYQDRILVPNISVEGSQVFMEYTSMHKIYALGLLRCSALVNYLDDKITKELMFHSPHTRKKNLSKALATVLTMNQICHELGWDFRVGNIDGHYVTKEHLEVFKEHGVETIDYGVDITKAIYNQMPYDLHPSDSANIIYAEKAGDEIEFLFSSYSPLAKN